MIVPAFRARALSRELRLAVLEVHVPDAIAVAGDRIDGVAAAVRQMPGIEAQPEEIRRCPRHQRLDLAAASPRSRRSDGGTPSGGRSRRGPRTRPLAARAAKPSHSASRSGRPRDGCARRAAVRCGTVVLSSDSTITGADRGLTPVPVAASCAATRCVDGPTSSRAVRTAAFDDALRRAPLLARARSARTRRPARACAALHLGGERRRIGRQESPVAQLGARVAGRGHLVQHLRAAARALARRLEFEHAPGAGCVRDANHRKSRSFRRAIFPSLARRLHLAGRRHLGDRHVPPGVVAADARLAIDGHDDHRRAALVLRVAASASRKRGQRVGAERTARRATPHWPRNRPPAPRHRARRLPCCDSGSACRSRRCRPIRTGRRCWRSRGCRRARS